MPECKFCGGVYAAQGGLTRHLSHCVERERDIARERAAAAREHELKLKSIEKQEKPDVVMTFNNCTFISVTQQCIFRVDKSFASFERNVADFFKGRAWKSFGDVKDGMKMLVGAISKSRDVGDREIGKYLLGGEIKFETEDGIKPTEVLEHMQKRGDAIDKQIVRFASSQLSADDRAKLEECVKKGSIWALE